MKKMPAWPKKKASTAPAPGARPPVVRVSELLLPESTLIAGPALDKAALIDALVARVCAAHGLPDAAALAARVREREQGISTTLDTGLSLPHARVDGLADLAAGLAVAPQGIADAKQGLSIRAMFLFFSPNKPQAFPLHLQVLRSAALLFSADLITALGRAATPQEALELVRARERAS